MSDAETPVTAVAATPPPPPPPAPATAGTSPLAVIALCAGIASWILLPFVAGLVAIVCGHLARAEIRRSQGALEGDGLAVIGLVLGWVNVVLAVLAVLAAVLFFGGLLVALGMLGLGVGH